MSRAKFISNLSAKGTDTSYACSENTQQQPLAPTHRLKSNILEETAIKLIIQKRVMAYEDK